MSFGWDPPALAVVSLGAAALVGWLAFSSPGRAHPLSTTLQLGAVVVMALALVNAGWRSPGAGARPSLTVLLDRSASMDVADGGPSRRAAADDWLEGPAFAAWSAGWRVRTDSFGAATSDPAAAVEAAAAALPEAILVLGDGRATGGRVAAAPGVPLYVHQPGPVTLPDAAVLELDVVSDDAGAVAAVEVAAVGGEPTPERSLVVLVDGRVVSRGRAPGLVAGERRVVRVPLPEPPGADERVVEARLEPPQDPVEGNDARAVVWRPPGPARALLAGLAPGWELGSLRRALEAGGGDPVETVWSGQEGLLRQVDGGGPVDWESLDPASFRTLWLVGDPALLGPEGRRWIDRWAAPGGRGLYWAAGPSGGEVAGARAPSTGGDPASGTAVLTESGRRWLEALGVESVRPSGPPLEGLPGAAVDLPAGARVLLRAGATPVAWSLERAGNRVVVTLGTGWYRNELEGGAEGRAFWAAWTESARRWLAAASPTVEMRVALPGGGRFRVGEPIVAGLSGEGDGARWRVVPAAGGREVAAGTANGDRIEVGALPAGAWRLEVTADGRTDTRALAVEAWTPDLARTEADTVWLAAAARASGGGRVDESALPAAAAASTEDGPIVGLGLVPWAFLGAALLVLGHWAVAARAR